ncbi:unnamed protein product [Cochlearia groenlandica]
MVQYLLLIHGEWIVTEYRIWIFLPSGSYGLRLSSKTTYNELVAMVEKKADIPQLNLCAMILEVSPDPYEVVESNELVSSGMVVENSASMVLYMGENEAETTRGGKHSIFMFVELWLKQSNEELGKS